MSNPFIAHSEISNEIYIICGKKKYPVTEQVVSAMKATGRLNERPQGEWIKHIDNLYPEDSTEECPFCHEEQRLVGNDDNFCPNCGAKMTKGAENE